MAQAGIHGLVGIAVRKWMPKKELLLLGVVVGNFAPDLDSLVTGIALLTGRDTHGLHRTFTHSLVIILGLMGIFYLLSTILKKTSIANLGLGLGIGMAMHAGLDLILWFRGVEIFWPFFGEVNFWQGFVMPDWWFEKFESAVEFLLHAVFLIVLAKLARQQGTDSDYLKTLRIWTWIQIALFLIFIVLVYTWDGYYMAWGVIYLISLGMAIGISIRMKKTIEGVGLRPA